MRRLLPLLALVALVAPAAARAETVAAGVEEAALFAGATPRVAYLNGRDLNLSTRGVAWSATRIARLPDDTGRVAAVRPTVVLVGSNSWLRAVVLRNGRWRVLRLADAPKDGRLGPGGLTLTRRGRPAIAYSLRASSGATELWLAQVATNLRLTRTRVTRNGFPPSSVPPAAQPVLMPDGSLQIVQTYTARGASAILWRREGNRWWGRFLHTGGVGGSAGLPFFAQLADDDLYVAWSVAYVVQRELHLVLTTRIDRSRSVVLHRNAVAAGLVLGPLGPEVAANENVAGLTAGVIFWTGPAPDVIFGGPPIELDGRIVAYARDSIGRWQLLIARNGALEWYTAPTVPHVRFFLDGPLTGRVEGASGGVVRVYRERPGVAREFVTEVPVDTDGRFAAVDPAPVAGTYYRLVYEREFPYALLAREPVP